MEVADDAAEEWGSEPRALGVGQSICRSHPRAKRREEEPGQSNLLVGFQVCDSDCLSILIIVWSLSLSCQLVPMVSAGS